MGHESDYDMAVEALRLVSNAQLAAQNILRHPALHRYAWEKEVALAHLDAASSFLITATVHVNAMEASLADRSTYG